MFARCAEHSCKSKAAALLAVALALTFLSGLGPARAASFPDIGDQPSEIQAAIDYATEMGYMTGAADGKFYPNEPMGRIDYARALIRVFKNLDEELDPNISFTDIKSSSVDFKYANLAVKHGYINGFSDGAFRPGKPVSADLALTGLVVGLGLGEPVAYLNGLYPRGPAYEGYEIVAHDLHLKYRSTKTWPADDYPRGEMAFSLQRVDKLEEWRIDYIKESFNWLHCQNPWTGPARKKALDSAFEKIGAPYVWGGESDEEHGFDCSGLTYYVLSSVLDYPMQRTADDQARDVRYPTVSKADLLPGDPIFFYSSATGDPTAYIGHAGMYVANGLFIHSTGSNGGVSVDRLSGYWSDQFAWGKRVIPEPEPETFDTYILLCNPDSAEAEAKLTYMLGGGSRFEQIVIVGPKSRRTVKIDDLLLNQEVSTKVEATRGEIIAERSMYYRYRGKDPGGHCSTGMTEPAQQWFLAEGCTAWSFDTYVLIQNPGAVAANVNVTFMRADGGTVELPVTVGGYSRYTIMVDQVSGMQNAEFSTRVTADQPVVVERSMYFDYKGIKEGHNSQGVTGLQSDWYFAEGYTGKAFDTYILLVNPSDMTANATLTLSADSGKQENITYVIAPHSRYTVAVDNIEGWEDREFSAEVHSPGVPIATERSMYFKYNGITGGHNAVGSPRPGNRWFLAEGYTGQEFDTYVLLDNPGDKQADVSVRYMLNGGRSIDKKYPVPAHSRYTICVDKVNGLAAAEVSAYINSSMPIVVERSMYFRYGTRQGGSCAPAVTNASGTWYFAEGYTGQ